MLCRHIPDRYEHLVRYVGWYSNRTRGERAKALKDRDAPTTPAAPVEADPLECPKCKGPMRIIALIDDPGVIRHILEHLGRWAPEATERGPPVPAADWPANALIPLTYHPLPDIA